MTELKSKAPETKKRLFTLKCVNASQGIHIGPCVVGNVIITSTDGNGLASVYDGLNNLAERKLHLACIVNTSFPTGAAQDHDFKHGIYVEVNDDTTFLMITYYPVEV